MRTLKNWWFAIAGFALIILDQGFDVINPLLVEIGLNSKWIAIVKLCFGLYGIYRLKVQLPTQNTEKLKEIVKNKVADDGPGGSNDPNPDPKDK